MSRVKLLDPRSLEHDPTAALWGSVGLIRQQLAEALMQVSPEDLRAAYEGELGRLHRLVVDSGVRDQLAAPVDLAFMQQGQRRLSGAALLAAMLFLHPHQLGGFVPLDQVPEYLQEVCLRFSLALPAIFMREGEADAYSRYLEAWLKNLCESVKANPGSALWRNAAGIAAMTVNLIPAYFAGRNLRDLQTSRAQLLEQALLQSRRQLDVVLGPRTNRPRIRLGILAAHFSPQTETFATLPVYRHLDREKFELILLSQEATDHPLERLCASCADRFVALPKGLAQQVRAIREEELDILWIGTNVAAVTNGITVLAAHRLARMQVASVCSCVTTGLKNVDYYVSGRLSEPASGAQEHYTEKLLMIDGPAHCYDFGTEAISATKAGRLTRAEVGIDEKAIVFASGANFFKILPELEDLWARILAATPGSRLMLYPFNTSWHSVYPVRRFIGRMQACLARNGVSADRLLIFGMAPDRSQVLARLILADIYLDSYPFAGATSLLDPLELGIPSLVMDGATFRSLVGAALLRDLKLEEFIVANAERYFDLAVKLASDAQYRAEAKKRFTAAMVAGPRFLDGKWFGREVGRILTEAWESAVAVRKEC